MPLILFSFYISLHSLELCVEDAYVLKNLQSGDPKYPRSLLYSWWDFYSFLSQSVRSSLSLTTHSFGVFIKGRTRLIVAIGF